MKWFESKKQRLSYTIIAGGTDFAHALAGLLSAQGDAVLIIAGNQKDFLSDPPSFDGNMIAGDVTDLHVLKEASMEKADTVLAATDNDNVNLLVAQLARGVFGVRHVVALLNDSERAGVYQEFDIPAFSPALICAKEIIKGLWDEKKAETL